MFLNLQLSLYDKNIVLKQSIKYYSYIIIPQHHLSANTYK